MFPIIDLRGNVVAFGGRIMSDQKPKYLNTADTPVFSKSHQLFALNMAKNVNTRQLILAEGYMDVIALHQAGFENAVATLGTALTPSQAEIMHRYADEVIICYDSDEAGTKASDRAIPMLRKAGLKVRVVTVPGAKDPDEFMKSHGDKGPAIFRVLLEKSAGDIDYKLEKLLDKYNINQTQGKVDYLTEAAAVIADSANSIERDIYISSLSERLGVKKDAIEQQVQKRLKYSARQQQRKDFRNISDDLSARHDKINPEKAKNRRAATAEEYLIAFLLENPHMSQYITSKVPPSKFATEFNKKVYSVALNKIESSGSTTLTALSQEFTQEELSYIAAFVATILPESLNKESLDQCITVLLQEHEKNLTESPKDMSDDDMLEYFNKLGKIKGG